MSKRTDKASYWQHHLDQWLSSGLTQKAYCQINQLSYASFGYWLKRLRTSRTERELQLVPVQINPAISTQVTICLQLAMCRIELPVYTDTGYIRALVEALS